MDCCALFVALCKTSADECYRNGIELSFWLPLLIHCPDWFATAMPKTTTMSMPLDGGIQVHLHILGHELICLSCKMEQFTPYLDSKLDCNDCFETARF